jgi:hypothetical protein
VTFRIIVVYLKSVIITDAVIERQLILYVKPSTGYSRGCTLVQSTLPSSEAECVKASRLASTVFLSLGETGSCDSDIRVVKINTV